MKNATMIVFLSAVGSIFAQSEIAAEDASPAKCEVAEARVQDMIDAYLADRGWVSGANAKDGRMFFVSTGTAVIQAPREKPASYIDSRVNAFNKAMLDAKKNMAEFLSVSIASETVRSYREGEFSKNDESDDGDADSVARKVKALVKAKLDNALRAEGIDPDAADRAVAERKAKELLATEEYRKLVSTAARANVVGMQAVCTFEGAPADDKGEIGVVAIWSPKLQAMASSIVTGIPVAKSESKKKPVVEQISTDAGALLSTFGVQQKIDQFGDLVLVGFGQAGGVSESKMAAKGAEGKAKANALAALREFAGENVAVATDMLNAESTEEFAKAADEYQDLSAFSERIRATASGLKIDGVTVIKNWRCKHPFTGTTVYGCIVAWAPKQSAAAKRIKNAMENPSAAANGVVPPAVKSSVKTVAEPSASSYRASGQSGDSDAF